MSDANRTERRRDLLRNNTVPIMFLAISAIVIVLADLELSRVSSDVSERVFRNLFLVLSLIIPIVAGLGLNFGIVLGAMAGQAGLIFVQNGEIGGLTGLFVAAAGSIPLAILLGYLTGLLLNRTKGREMITGIILGFFANGIYQFVFLILAGPVIPIHAGDVVLTKIVDGQAVPLMGLRNTVNLTTVEAALDYPLEHFASTSWVREAVASVFGDRFTGSIPIRFGDTKWASIPILTLLVNVGLCLGLTWFLRTKLGQDLRAVGQDSHVAEVSGIRVDRCRVIAIIISMILAAFGQIIFLQNMAVMNTYQSHEQVGFYAIAALLVGGATVSRATIWNAIVGTVLFHLLIVVVSTAGARLDSPQVGEYLREFFAFAVIGVTLALHAWRTKRR
ncbi:MAG: ABC transporter permease [Planctomycetes bacterium]|nr:ABC transporter permease [Planctomycetota bacterium]